MANDGTGNQIPSAEFVKPNRPLPAKGVFEVGITLAGAVSAGAYIAGVMDFLIQALDAWDIEKQVDVSSTPDHDTILRIISGASGGGMNGAIFAAMAGAEIDHIETLETASNRQTGNPFFDAWVNDIDMDSLLSTDDLEEQVRGVPSLLNSAGLMEIADRAVQNAKHSALRRRSWLANPFRVFLTTGNLRGVTYKIPRFAYTMRHHKDHVRFAVVHEGGYETDQDPAFPDEVVLQGAPNINLPNWRALSTTALATGAFPVVLAPRVIEAAIDRYMNRRGFEHPPGEEKIQTMPPSKDEGTENFSYLAVDGGTMDNEPLELARQVLAGALGRNDRKGSDAKRATILVDPFVQPSAPGPASDRNDDGSYRDPFSNLFSLINAWTMQSRFNPTDLALALDEEGASRFLVAPSRNGKRDGALASSLFDAFGGFFERDFRAHDFLLGRRNCQWFLATRFLLPAENSLFESWRDKAFAEDYAQEVNGERYLPIIPLVSAVRPGEQSVPLPAWPQDALSQGRIDRLIHRIGERFDAVYHEYLKYHGVSWAERTYLGPLRRGIKKMLKRGVQQKIESDKKRLKL